MTSILDQSVFSFSSLLVPIQAFIVGVIGSFAYYVALKLGYVVAEQRATLLRLFAGRTLLQFCAVGGCVATVFQLAQIAVFAPVQAFVLGVTWPIMVAQYVTAAKKVEEQEFIDVIRGKT